MKTHLGLMINMRLHTLAVLLCIALIGCSTVQKGYIEQPEIGFREPVAKTLEALPQAAAGFDKPRKVRFHPEISAYTTAYAQFSDALDNVTTIYLYPKSPDTPDLLEVHVREIPITHPGAQLTAVRKVEIPQRAGTQVGHFRVFSYSGVLNGRNQEVWSCLIVASVSDRVLVVRSTSPVAQSTIAEQRLLQLLSVLQWSD